MELEDPFPQTVPPVTEVFDITREDAHILEEYVEEFQEGDADLRNTIIANVMAELCALRPETFPFNKMEASKVPFHNIPSEANKANILFRRLESGSIITILSLCENMSNLLASGPLAIHSTTCVVTKS
jgi:hypothetical protein